MDTRRINAKKRDKIPRKWTYGVEMHRENTDKDRKRDKNINKICVCQEFCVSLSSDLDKKKDESKMDRVGE